MRREDVPDSNLTSMLGCSVPGYTTEETPLSEKRVFRSLSWVVPQPVSRALDSVYGQGQGDRNWV